jgi:hypothetical protein
MPFHEKRTWVIDPEEPSPEQLAVKFLSRSWCNCQGWRIGRYLFLNDQTSADGAFEVAIVKVPGPEWGWWHQVESITFGWMRSTPFGETAEQKAVRLIREAIAGKMDPGEEDSVAWRIEPPTIETPEQHGRCRHCA